MRLDIHSHRMFHLSPLTEEMCQKVDRQQTARIRLDDYAYNHRFVYDNAHVDVDCLPFDRQLDQEREREKRFESIDGLLTTSKETVAIASDVS